MHADAICFNCENSRTCAFYFEVESLVWVDAPWHVLQEAHRIEIRNCPYCTREDEPPFDNLVNFWLKE